MTPPITRAIAARLRPLRVLGLAIAVLPLASVGLAPLGPAAAEPETPQAAVAPGAPGVPDGAAEGPTDAGAGQDARDGEPAPPGAAETVPPPSPVPDLPAAAVDMPEPVTDGAARSAPDRDTVPAGAATPVPGAALAGLGERAPVLARDPRPVRSDLADRLEDDIDHAREFVGTRSGEVEDLLRWAEEHQPPPPAPPPAPAPAPDAVAESPSVPAGRAGEAAQVAATTTDAPGVTAAPEQETAPETATDPEAVSAWLRRGDQFLQSGDIASARLFYRLAADADSVAGAERLGRTFDPLYFSQARVFGINPDPAEALTWYRTAAEAGDAVAGGRLQDLITWLRGKAGQGDAAAARALERAGL